MPYPIFDRRRLRLKPLSERVHDMTLDDVLRLDDPIPPFDDPALAQVAERVTRANRAAAQVILMMGAHVIKRGLSRFVVDLMERGIITHVGLNGAGPIHDFELALIGGTTEVTGLRSDGSEFPVELSLASWRTNQGMFFTGILRDVTADRRLEGLRRRCRTSWPTPPPWLCSRRDSGYRATPSSGHCCERATWAGCAR